MKPIFNKTRALSWSALASFAYNREEWFKRYVLKEPSKETPEMLFGKVFAKSCEDRKPLAPVTLLSKMEHKFEVVFNKIPLIGYADTFNDITKDATGEFKTGKKKWEQKRCDEHGQITMYALMNYITNKIDPSKCDFFLEWIPTCDMGDFTIDFVRPIKVHHFKTKRTMNDILQFGVYINKVYKEMEEYTQNHE